MLPRLSRRVTGLAARTTAARVITFAVDRGDSTAAATISQNAVSGRTRRTARGAVVSAASTRSVSPRPLPSGTVTTSPEAG